MSEEDEQGGEEDEEEEIRAYAADAAGRTSNKSTETRINWANQGGASAMKADQLMRQPVTDLVEQVQIFPSSDPLSKVIGYLKGTKVGEALVDDGNASTCIVSIRDVLSTTNLNTKIAKVMHQVPRLGPNNTVGDAATLMHEYRARSMPVYKEKKFVGQVTSLKVVARLLESETPGRVSSLMTPSPFCIDTSDSVGKAREMMLKRKVDQLPVTRDRALYGVITSGEIVFNMMPKAERMSKGDTLANRYDEPLSNFDLTDVVSNDITDSLRDVYQNMVNSNANYSVITATDEIQGIVTYRDFLRVMARKLTESSIPMYIVGLPDDPFEAGTARKKFLGAVELLHRAVPDIAEARAVIKMGETKSPKKKYEVKVFLVHPKDHYSYSVRSYELADAFDEVNNWVKELVERSRDRKKIGQKKRTSNARSYPNDFRPETAPG
jgi:CBS domain-containing protein/cellobiose-specific phosphotransferase system component IIA